MKGPLYLCADIGGTQIKTGLLDGAGRLVGAIHREDSQAGLPQQPLLDHIAACLLAPWPGEVPVAGVCLAMPGPCDYPAGHCWIEGLEKYGSLYGADLRRELGARLAPALGPAGENLLFQNDVAAFALGELRCGCAQGIQRGLFVCIGTGCGSAFTVGDALALEGTPGVPPQGYLYPLPLAGKRVDDWLSRRGLQELSRRRLGRPLEGLPLAQLAQAGEPGALAVWEEFGQLLAQALPRVDFRLQLGKTLSSEIESVFLPMSLSLDGGQSLCLKKGGEAFRPGVDQLPGTCMEYSMSDDGLAYVCPQGSVLIASYDVPLFYFGEMAHHPIRLCDNREENNRRPVYSWVMNNTWETNFKMDLSGFGEYRYTMWLSGETDPQRAMEELRERCFEPWPLITG